MLRLFGDRRVIHNINVLLIWAGVPAGHCSRFAGVPGIRRHRVPLSGSRVSLAGEVMTRRRARPSGRGIQRVSDRHSGGGKSQLWVKRLLEVPLWSNSMISLRLFTGFFSGAAATRSASRRLLSDWPSAAHLMSWACVCPRNEESAGKRRSNRQRKGGNWLKTTLAQCGLAAAKKKRSYLQAQFHRIKARRGPKKAIMAVVASILTAI